MKIYRLASAHPRLFLAALPGDTPATMSEGYGGWEVVERDRNKSFTRWKGGPPWQMTFSVMLDGFRARRRIGTEYLILERMARARDGDDEPPVIYISGPHPRSERMAWVIESIEWPEDKKLLDVNGRLVRAQANIIVREHVDPDLIAISKAKKRRKKKKGKKKKPRRKR